MRAQLSVVAYPTDQLPLDVGERHRLQFKWLQGRADSLTALVPGGGVANQV